MLLDYTLFEDRFIRVGLLVANLDAFVFELARKVVGVGFFGEFVNVFAGAVLLHVVTVLQRDEEAGCLWDRRYLPIEDDSFNRGPILGDRLAAALLPSTPVDRGPGEREVYAVANSQYPEMGIMSAHGWYGITRRPRLRSPTCVSS